MFDEARERYNAKQKWKDRVIDNYYEKIRRGKQEKLFHEVIFQIGNKDDMNAKSEDGLLAKRILTEFMDESQARNPNLYVFSAHLHMDEETPHLHIDFVPYITGSKRGLDTRVSLKSALAAEGFTGGTRGATELNQWIASEKKKLATVMERYGVEWLQKGTHEKHLSVLEFEKKERAREVAELDSQKREISSVVAQLGEEVSVKKQELQNVTIEKELAEEATQKAEVAKEIVAEFKELWNSSFALPFDEFYENYSERYKIIKRQREVAKQERITSIEKYKLQPNSMQVGFITNLKKIIGAGEDRALLISATGTGKTYASAFAMRELGFKRVLFLVHRGQLARQTRRSYEKVFAKSVSMGLVGAGYHEYDADYVFATVQTLNRDEHLLQYEKDAFDCIVLDDERVIIRTKLEKPSKIKGLALI